jgi:hypothetical protein
VTWYVTAVFVPGVIVPRDTNVATPDERSSVHVPSPATVIVSDAMHNPVAVSMKHVFVVSNSVPVAKGVVPVMLLYVAVSPGSSVITSGVATGTGGGVTVGVIVAESI